MKWRKQRDTERGPAPKVWRGYRNCERCTRWRPVSDFTVYLTRSGYEQIKGECEACKRERAREAYNKLTPEEKRAKGKKANKQAHKRRSDALDFIERQREILDKQNDKIERLEEKVERAQAVARRKKLFLSNGRDYVDIVPFRMWLLRMNRECGYDTSRLAREIGEDEARVRRWLDGFQWDGIGRDPVPISSIKIANVDKIAVAMGDPGLMERLYPFDVDV